MPDLTARITEILREAVPVGDVWPFAISTLTERIAAAAQEHYRPVIETVEQLRGIKPRPDLASGALIRVSGYPFFGAVFELNDDGTWNNFDRNDESEARIAPEDVPLPVELLWTPGAGE